MDAASADNSVAIIRQYEPWLAHWASEPDRGQSNAINKGLELAGGVILGWLNSDDMLTSGALRAVARRFRDTGCDVVSGRAVVVDQQGECLGRYRGTAPSLSGLLHICETREDENPPQASTFWSRAVWNRCGKLREDLGYCMDYEFWMRLARAQAKWAILDKDLSVFRIHDSQKMWSCAQRVLEMQRILSGFGESPCYNSLYHHALRRALFCEAWLLYWGGVCFLARRNLSWIVHWLRAPFFNWRCLVTPPWYARTAQKAAKCLRKAILLNWRCLAIPLCYGKMAQRLRSLR